MKRVLIFLVPMLLASCTFNISMLDTHGTSSDLVDDTTTTDLTVKPGL